MAIEPGGAVLLPGGSTVAVVGESFYQEALEEITGGRTEDGHNLQKWAILIREPENPYDRNAVAVHIDGHKVGHLSRNDALEYGAFLEQLWEQEGAHAACLANINGGWCRFAKDGVTVIDEGHFGVKLALAEADALVGIHDLTILSVDDLAAGPDAEDAPTVPVGKSVSERLTDASESMEQTGKDMMGCGCAVVVLVIIVFVLYVAFTS